METSLLTTKLNIPPKRPQLVPRTRLVERLQEGLSYNLLLVSAPAGFGKSTLLSEWAHQSQPRIRTAWVSLDEGDNDPIHFWDYFIAALKTLQPAFGESSSGLLHSPQPQPVESLLSVLINEMATVSFEFVLILDDYHAITSPPIHNGIAYLLDHLPPQMHLVIATRADPPLPLSRFRGKGTMLEIRTDDLRFSRDEAAKLIRELKAPEFSDDNLDALNSHTEGWAVGLKMAALAMQHRPDISRFLADFTGSQRYIMDYLVEEVLQQQSEQLQEFLLKASVLERLTAPLCNFITGRKDSRDMILKLENDNLFIVPLDESRQWYRYEHLFADLLRHQCETSSGKEAVAGLHQQASQWYEDNNLPDDAIHHALAAKDWEKAAELITEHGEKKLESGQNVTMYNWLQQMPEEFILTYPELCLQYCQAMQTAGSLNTAWSLLKTLEKKAQGNDRLMGQITASQAYTVWLKFDMPQAEKLAQKALLLLTPDQLHDRAIMSQVLGWIHNGRGDFREAELFFTEAYKAFKQFGSDFGVSGSLGGLMSIANRKGELRRAAEMAQQVIELYGQSGASVVVPLIILAAILYEWNDLEAANNNIQRVIDFEKFLGTMMVRVQVHDILAYYRLAQGDEAGCIKALERADFEARTFDDMPTNKILHAAYHVQIALKQDDLNTASEWGNILSKYADYLFYSIKHIPLRLLIAQGNKSAAADNLRVLYDEAIHSESQHYMIIYRVYQALAAETEEEALEFLSDALTMAEPEGYIRTFVDEGKLLKPLLEKALSKGITPEYTRKLLTIIEAEERQKRLREKGEGTTSTYQALLSERELEVLCLMAEGLSNQQIAGRLIISLSTAKNHVHNILEKLNVRGRTQAVAQARELELI